MVRPSKPRGKAQDLRAVCSMVWGLLGLGKTEGTGGTTRLLASDFAAAPSSVTMEGLLLVSLDISQDIFTNKGQKLTLVAYSILF